MSATVEVGSGAAGKSCTIVELGAVDPLSIKKYLADRGQDPAYTDWKYFDAAFNADRVRGFAAVQGGEVVGFIGLIPFNAVVDGEMVETAWTCDWSVDDAKAGPIVGISLMKSAIRAHPRVFHVGGNEITEKIFSRLAAHYERDAVCEYAVHLTVASHVDRLIAKAPGLAPLRKMPMGRVRAKSFAQEGLLEVTQGLAPEALDVFADRWSATTTHPHYDARYVQWQIAACPNHECYSCYAQGEAAGLMWRPRGSNKEFRLAIAATASGQERLEAVVRSLVRHAYDQKADIAKVRVSQRDASLRKMLDGLGFRTKQHLPYFAFYDDPAGGPDDVMSGMSFLDVDEASTGWS